MVFLVEVEDAGVWHACEVHEHIEEGQIVMVLHSRVSSCISTFFSPSASMNDSNLRILLEFLFSVENCATI
jgi:hypothetical protein